MQIYGLAGKWDENSYDALLDAAKARGGYCVLALRNGASRDCLVWIKERAPDLETRVETMRWPGTIVYDEADKATLLKFRITAELIDGLRTAARSPFEWLGPELPEDLSFLRPDGTPWFVSIAHEEDAFFKLHGDEIDELREQLRNVELIAQGQDQVPEERY